MEKIKYNSLYNRKVKPVLGFVMAVLFLLVLWPIYAVIAILIMVDSGTPILYSPLRGGYKNKPFQIFKFRTMVKNADKIGGGTTALNDPRITKVGNVLRKTKLDEIPQLFNILNGTMSFIGPRPELLKYVDKYEDNEKIILEVRPGITDYSSVEFINLDEIVGSDNADEIYETKVLKKKNALRIKYAETVSFKIDCYLFFNTIWRVIKKAFLFITGKTQSK
jgi:lipopolysaccharide/colanic/teichoic acid biosynthesis glycosyltransferase